MKRSTAVSLIMALILIILGGVTDYFLLRTKVSTGTDLEVSMGERRYTYLTIDAESVEVEGASHESFVLLRDSGEALSGIRTQPPLGVDFENYFVARPTTIKGGKWYLSQGSVFLHLKSEKNFTVYQDFSVGDTLVGSLLTFIVCCVLWIFFMVVAGEVTNSYEV